MPWLFRLSGLLAMLGGSFELWTDLKKNYLGVGESGSRHALQSARRQYLSAEYRSSVQTADLGLKWAPLSWQLYFARAKAGTGLGSVPEALADFKCAGLLQPDRPEIAQLEGDFWMSYGSPLALPAWHDAITMDQASASSRFGQIIEAARGHSNYSSAFELWAGERADLLLAFVGHAAAEERKRSAEEWLKKDPELLKFTDSQLAATFFPLLWEVDRVQLLEGIRSRPRWEKVGWRWLARNFADEKDYVRAYQTVISHILPPVLPSLPQEDRETLRRRVILDSSDFASAIALYQIEAQDGRKEEPPSF